MPLCMEFIDQLSYSERLNRRNFSHDSFKCLQTQCKGMSKLRWYEGKQEGDTWGQPTLRGERIEPSIGNTSGRTPVSVLILHPTWRKQKGSCWRITDHRAKNHSAERRCKGRKQREWKTDSLKDNLTSNCQSFMMGHALPLSNSDDLNEKCLP